MLSDSKPCIQAYEKLTQGEFSSSARVSTFLSTLSRYHINLQICKFLIRNISVSDALLDKVSYVFHKNSTHFPKGNSRVLYITAHAKAWFCICMWCHGPCPSEKPCNTWYIHFHYNGKDYPAVAGATILVDGSTALQSLVGDPILAQHGISLEVGRLRNRNKSPVAEKAIQEIEVKLKTAVPQCKGNPVPARSFDWRSVEYQWLWFGMWTSQASTIE